MAGRNLDLESEREAREALLKGIEFLEKGESLKALSSFEKAYRLKDSAEYRSYFGLAIAMERGKLKEGISFCEEAVSMEPENPVLYLNLGKALFRAERKKDAIEVVRKGIKFGANKDALTWLETLGIRRKPVLPFLPRGHFLNKLAGLVLSRMGIDGPSGFGTPSEKQGKAPGD